MAEALLSFVHVYSATIQMGGGGRRGAGKGRESEREKEEEEAGTR